MGTVKTNSLKREEIVNVISREPTVSLEYKLRRYADNGGSRISGTLPLHNGTYVKYNSGSLLLVKGTVTKDTLSVPAIGATFFNSCFYCASRTTTGVSFKRIKLPFTAYNATSFDTFVQNTWNITLSPFNSSYSVNFIPVSDTKILFFTTYNSILRFHVVTLDDSEDTLTPDLSFSGTYAATANDMHSGMPIQSASSSYRIGLITASLEGFWYRVTSAAPHKWRYMTLEGEKLAELLDTNTSTTPVLNGTQFYGSDRDGNVYIRQGPIDCREYSSSEEYSLKTVMGYSVEMRKLGISTIWKRAFNFQQATASFLSMNLQVLQDGKVGVILGGDLYCNGGYIYSYSMHLLDRETGALIPLATYTTWSSTSFQPYLESVDGSYYGEYVFAGSHEGSGDYSSVFAYSVNDYV